jgi:hypothetical protein
MDLHSEHAGEGITPYLTGFFVLYFAYELFDFEQSTSAIPCFFHRRLLDEKKFVSRTSAELQLASALGRGNSLLPELPAGEKAVSKSAHPHLSPPSSLSPAQNLPFPSFSLRSQNGLQSCRFVCPVAHVRSSTQNFFLIS